MGVPVVADKSGNLWFGGKKFTGKSAVKDCVSAGAKREWVTAANKKARGKRGDK